METPKAILFQVLCPGLTLNSAHTIQEFLAVKRPSGGYWVTNETAGCKSLGDTYPDGTPRTKEDFYLERG